jgi:hypothetical protein
MLCVQSGKSTDSLHTTESDFVACRQSRLTRSLRVGLHGTDTMANYCQQRPPAGSSCRSRSGWCKGNPTACHSSCMGTTSIRHLSRDRRASTSASGASTVHSFDRSEVAAGPSERAGAPSRKSLVASANKTSRSLWRVACTSISNHSESRHCTQPSYSYQRADFFCVAGSTAFADLPSLARRGFLVGVGVRVTGDLQHQVCGERWVTLPGCVGAGGVNMSSCH